MCVGRPGEHPALSQVQPGAGPNHEENSSQCCQDHPTGNIDERRIYIIIFVSLDSHAFKSKGIYPVKLKD